MASPLIPPVAVTTRLMDVLVKYLVKYRKPTPEEISRGSLPPQYTTCLAPNHYQLSHVIDCHVAYGRVYLVFADGTRVERSMEEIETVTLRPL